MKHEVFSPNRAAACAGTPASRAETRQAQCAACDLRGALLCRTVADADLPGVRPARLRRLSRNATLVEQGEEPGIAGIVRCGVLRMERMLSDGRRSILGLALPGDTVGLLELDQSRCIMQAATDVEICAFDRKTVQTMRQRDSRFRDYLIQEAADQQTALREMIWQRGVLNSRERIMAVLAWAARTMPVESLPDGGLIVTMLLSRRDWADLANTTVESISRTVRWLSEKGLVETVAPGRYRIADPDLLARMAGIDPQLDVAQPALPRARAGDGRRAPAARLTTVNVESRRQY